MAIREIGLLSYIRSIGPVANPGATYEPVLFGNATQLPPRVDPTNWGGASGPPGGRGNQSPGNQGGGGGEGGGGSQPGSGGPAGGGDGKGEGEGGKGVYPNPPEFAFDVQKQLDKFPWISADYTPPRPRGFGGESGSPGTTLDIGLTDPDLREVWLFPPPGGWGITTSWGGIFAIPTLWQQRQIRYAFEIAMTNAFLNDYPKDEAGNNPLIDCLKAAWSRCSFAQAPRGTYPCDHDRYGNGNYQVIGPRSLPVIYFCEPIDYFNLNSTLVHELIHDCGGSEIDAWIAALMMGLDNPEFHFELILERFNKYNDDMSELVDDIVAGRLKRYTGADSNPCEYESKFFIWNCETGEVWMIDQITKRRGPSLFTAPALRTRSPFKCC